MYVSDTLNHVPDYSIIITALIVLVIPAIAAITAQILYHQLRKIKDAQYMTILHKAVTDLHALSDQEKSLKTRDDCDLHAVRLLDIMSGIAHLNLQKKITDDALDFLKYDFKVAYHVMAWYHENSLDKKYGDDAKEIWANLTRYYDRHPYFDVLGTDVLPVAFRNYANLETDLFVYGTLMDAIERGTVFSRQVITKNNTLDEYSKSSVKIENIEYPALVSDKSGKVDGVVFQVTPDELKKIDDWETCAYRRIRVTLKDDSKAWTYVKADEFVKLQ